MTAGPMSGERGGEGGATTAPSAAPPEPPAPVPLGPGVRRRRSDLTGPALRRRRTLVLGGMAGLTLAGVLLAAAGVSMVRNSTVGRYEQALGADEPGYQALVVPTPTLAVVQRAPDGTLAGISLLALEPGDDGGSVVVVPPSLVAAPDRALTTTLADVYRSDGAAGATASLGGVLAVAMGEHVELDDADWARLVEPVGPVELTLDNAVGEWAAGPIRLGAADVGRFLAARDPEETDLDRLERQEQFWTAWLQQVGEGDDDAVPGEVESGVGRFVRGIAGDTVLTEALPVERDDQPDGLHLRPNPGQASDLLAHAVPFPTSPGAGARVKVRLLNGTSDPSLTTEAATFLVANGSEIDIVGNASGFDVSETTVSYAGGDRLRLAAWVAAVLGTENLEELPPAEDEIDVTVVLGNDARDLIGR
jgi:LytR cell envelope-related transcriptional attenuator